ncbi:MAG: hypothetical protein ACXVBW_01000, partial [Bdellovibrionota bacterium]
MSNKTSLSMARYAIVAVGISFLASACGGAVDPSASTQSALSPVDDSLRRPGPTATNVPGNLIQDPGFESGVSTFAPDSSNATAVRTTTSPIVGTASLQTTLKTWGANVWWSQNVTGTSGVHSSQFQVIAKTRGVSTSSTSNFNVCADVLYAGAGAMTEICQTASKTIGTVNTLTATLAL